MLYNWDAVQFALALARVRRQQAPAHPPGYILYVGLGRIVNAWLGDRPLPMRCSPSSSAD